MQAIDKEFSEDYKKTLKTIDYATLSITEYLSTRFNYVVKGLGTKDKLWINILISITEIDMTKTKKYCKQLYGKVMIIPFV